MATKPEVTYENNPFMIGIEGLKLLFSKAKGTGIYAISLTASAFLIGIVFYIVMIIVDIATGNQPSPSANSVELTDFNLSSFLAIISIVAVVTVVYAAVSLLLFGPLEYAAAMTAQGKEASL